MFKRDLSYLSESQMRMIGVGGTRAVVDCDGNAIGTARSKHGAAMTCLRMANGKYDMKEVGELAETVHEYDDCYVIGKPNLGNTMTNSDE